MLPKIYIKIYKRKYLGGLQGETRKLHKISEDKNLTESAHRKISQTVFPKKLGVFLGVLFLLVFPVKNK